jgi:hypothetical protein
LVKTRTAKYPENSPRIKKKNNNNNNSSLGPTSFSQALASSTIFFHLSLSNANPTGHPRKFNPAEFPGGFSTFCF